MKEENAIVQRGSFINATALQQIEGLSAKLIDSEALPNTIKNASQLMMVLLSGYEADMTPMQAINSFYIVNGKITIWGSAVITQLRKAGWTLEWIESTDKKAHVKISKGDVSGEDSFTIEEAKTAGLTGKGPWRSYPKDMLRWKAIGRCIRFTCPEVLGGYYMKEDIEANVIDADVHVREVKPQETPDLAPITQVQLDRIDELVAEIGADRAQVDEWILKMTGTELKNLTHQHGRTIVKSLEARLAKEKAESEQEDDSDDETPPEEPQEVVGSTENGNPRGTVTDAQLKKIHAIRNEKGWGEEELNARSLDAYGQRISGLSKEQAMEVIDMMENGKEVDVPVPKAEYVEEEEVQETPEKEPGVPCKECDFVAGSKAGLGMHMGHVTRRKTRLM